jgi:sulfate adenylyltransferase
MPKPHGGKIINRHVNKEIYNIRDLPNFEISTNQSEDILNIGNGVFSPLEGFLTRNDLDCVITHKRL